MYLIRISCHTSFAYNTHSQHMCGAGKIMTRLCDHCKLLILPKVTGHWSINSISNLGCYIMYDWDIQEDRHCRYLLEEGIRIWWAGKATSNIQQLHCESQLLLYSELELRINSLNYCNHNKQWNVRYRDIELYRIVFSIQLLEH